MNNTENAINQSYELYLNPPNLEERQKEVNFNLEVGYWKAVMLKMDEEIKGGKSFTQEEIDLPYNELNRLTVEKLEMEKKKSVQ